MLELKANNEKIVKNTLFLYGRMLFSMFISLYTARVVITTLGISDFGLYNVLGGIIAFFSVLKSLVSTGTQRFLTYEMGKGSSKERLADVFFTSLSMFIIIGIVVFFLSETIGLWFINNCMQIPEGRKYAANVVFQISIASVFVSVVQLPYTAVIMSHERMDIYGYVGLSEPVLKLLFILLLPFLPFDKLITYSLIIFFISIVMAAVYIVCCNKLFEECRLTRSADKSLFKKMLSFTSWNLLESLSNMMSSQGQDILINLFFGTTVNASRAIAVQVKNAVHGFATNFLVAMFPQITKTYAAGDLNSYYKLIIRGAKFSYLILAILMIPILLNTEYLLELWLGVFPEESELFCRLIMLALIISMVSESLYTGIQATGNLKLYQICTSSLMLLNIPISYLFFKMGLPAYTTFCVSVFFSIIIVITRAYFIYRETEFPILKYIKTILVDCFGVTVIIWVPLYIINDKLESSFLNFVLVTFSSLLWSTGVFFFVSMSKNERSFVFNLIKKK